MRASTIEWTDTTWNPIRGCSRVSEGCRHCYAERMAARFSGPGQPFEGLARRTSAGPRWTGEVEMIGQRLLDPVGWRKPRRVFVNSMSDLFHEGLEDRQIDLVFAIMALTPRHTYQILTKRPQRMLEYLTVTKPGADGVAARIADATWELAPSQQEAPAGIVHVPVGPLLSTGEPEFGWRRILRSWPLPNVWLGVSVEDQERADERIPPLLQTPAAARFISAEPLLGPVDLDPLWLRASPSAAFRSGRVTPEMPSWTRIGSTALDWVIVGGESGPGARRMEVDWARSIVEQCRAAGVPVFVKQLGSHGKVHPKGGDPSEWPEDLRVREFPEVAA